MKRLDILLGGLFGGAAPYLLGMANDAFHTPTVGQIPFYGSLGYWVGTALFGIIGAAVAYFMEQTDRKKAFAMGAAAPGIVLGLMQGSSSGSGSALSSLTPATHSQRQFVSVAFAREIGVLEPRSVQGHDTLRVRISGIGPALARYRSVGFIVTTPGEDIKSAKYASLARDSLVAIPRGNVVYLVVGGVTSDPLDLSHVNRDTIAVALTVIDQGFVSGLARTFGLRSVAWKPQGTVTPDD